MKVTSNAVTHFFDCPTTSSVTMVKKLHLPTEDSWWTSGGEVGEGAGHHAVDQHHEKVALLPQLSFAKLRIGIHYLAGPPPV
jgi:hypothetical protein